VALSTATFLLHHCAKSCSNPLTSAVTIPAFWAGLPTLVIVLLQLSMQQVGLPEERVLLVLSVLASSSSSPDSPRSSGSCIDCT